MLLNIDIQAVAGAASSGNLWQSASEVCGVIDKSLK